MEKAHDNNKEDITDICEQKPENLLLFTVNDIRFAIPAGIIDHVIRMVEITPLPHAPPGVVGIINYHGQILPVFSLRTFLRFPDKVIKPSDFLLITRKTRNIAIIAEFIGEVFSPTKDIVSPGSIIPGISGLSGVYQCNDGLLVITCPEDFLTSEDEESLQKLYESLVAI